MNFALSQRRNDRHPVGLMIVVGLHVVLAAALLSAKLKTGPAETQAVPMIPIDPPKPIVQPTADLPKPPAHTLQPIVLPIPDIPVENKDTIQVPKGDAKPVTVEQEPTVVIADRGRDVAPVRVTPHHGSLNATAESCRPMYPASAQRAGATGVTRLRFSVDATGRVLGAQILQSSGSSRENRQLDQAAAAALAQCPVTMGNDDQGRAVPFTTDVDYIWSLN